MWWLWLQLYLEVGLTESPLARLLGYLESSLFQDKIKDFSFSIVQKNCLIINIYNDDDKEHGRMLYSI